MLLVIKGAGDLASGVALRLYRSGIIPIMTDIPWPTAIRRTVSFCQAVFDGTTPVENVLGRVARDAEHALEIRAQGDVPVLVDPDARCVQQFKPDVVVDAVLAKYNTGTRITDAPIVLALGPGFTAGEDCHAVIETKRGHDMGRVLYQGSAIPNTGVPGLIAGYGKERLLRAPCAGRFQGVRRIGDVVQAGDVAATVEGHPIVCEIKGVLRGLLPDGTMVQEGMKSGDVDPRCTAENCYTVSDKARALGGAVLEALLTLSKSRGIQL